jgi:hypothetical protein
MTTLLTAIGQITAAHEFSDRLLAEVPNDLWFRMPHEGVTHVAWQAGHMAIAKFRLGVEFLRERRPEDDTWHPLAWVKLFGRGSTPQADAGLYPTIDEIRAAKQRVYEHLIAELQMLDPSTLDEPALVEHRFVRTKGDALFWCARHEMTHAGQVALLKRLLGMPAAW